ncbi:MAG: hypothetical protein KGI29_01800 [Pseudomonadota bacterium]|nr:hypothetical protein [Pseudomonadota bacterium]MDE3038053.1 hypothetical protein [Pseudomonadota bacterium]
MVPHSYMQPDPVGLFIMLSDAQLHWVGSPFGGGVPSGQVVVDMHVHVPVNCDTTHSKPVWHV